MEKCLNHPWAVDVDGFCWKCDQEREQRRMREELMNEGIDVPMRLDSVVTSVINQFKRRAEAGKQKYGVDLDREDLTLIEWIEHAKQEHMDAILYLEKIKQMLEKQ
jgi:hypothetical protein